MALRVRCLTSLVALTIVVGLPPREAAAQAGRVHGRVLDAESGEPIRGAAVKAESPQGALSALSVISDNKGRFAMIGLRSGNWALSASAPGYEPAGGLLRVQSVGNSEPLEFRLTKKPMVSVSPLVGIDTKAITADLQTARALLEQGKADESIAAYQTLLTKLPMLSTAHLQIARAYRLKKDFPAAMSQYSRIPESDSRFGLARVEMGMMEMERGDLAAADRILTAAVSAPDAVADTYYSLAEVKRAQALSAEATTWYRKATEADPMWSRPYVKLGQMALDQGDRSSAVEYLERAMRLQPEGPDASEARRLLDRTPR